MNEVLTPWHSTIEWNFTTRQTSLLACTWSVRPYTIKRYGKTSSNSGVEKVKTSSIPSRWNLPESSTANTKAFGEHQSVYCKLLNILRSRKLPWNQNLLRSDCTMKPQSERNSRRPSVLWRHWFFAELKTWKKSPLPPPRRGDLLDTILINSRVISFYILFVPLFNYSNFLRNHLNVRLRIHITSPPSAVFVTQ